jgi:hypothetical protein
MQDGAMKPSSWFHLSPRKGTSELEYRLKHYFQTSADPTK